MPIYRLLCQATLIVAVCWVFILWIRAVLLCTLGDYDARDNMPMWVRRAVVIFILPVMILLALAESGDLFHFDPTPHVLPILQLMIWGVSTSIAVSPLGRIIAKNTSWRALVGFQSFRFLAELVIFFGVQAGIAPAQMSFEGYNPDIYFALWSIYGFFTFGKNENLGLIRIWNGVGLFSLIIILFIAVTSMPTPIRLFMSEPSNIWITQVPYILLPGVLVTAALTGHFIAIRKFFMGRVESSVPG